MAGKRLDLTEQRFGKIVIEKYSHSKNKKAYWIGKCDCGNTTKPIRADALRENATTSCGCTAKAVLGQSGYKKAKDISQKEFGYLTALVPTKQRKWGKIIWECKCKCGNICYVTQGDLQQKEVSSCGCKRTSNLHDKVKQSLINLGIESIHEEYPLLKNGFGVLRVDIMVLLRGKEIAVECQGRQHYEPVLYFGGNDEYEKIQERDKRKRDYLYKQNIRLIEVRYDCPDIQNYLQEELSL